MSDWAYIKQWRARNADKWRAYARQWKRDRKAVMLAARAAGADPRNPLGA